MGKLLEAEMDEVRGGQVGADIGNESRLIRESVGKSEAGKKVNRGEMREGEVGILREN